MARRFFTPFALIALSVALLSLPAGGVSRPEEAEAAGSAPIVRTSSRHDVSIPIRDLPAHVGRVGHEEEDVEFPAVIEAGIGPDAPDGALDASAAAAATAMPAPLKSFEGIDNIDGVLPPDTNGDVGPNHYVQMVNSNFAIWNKKTNKLVYGPAANNTLWRGLGGACERFNDGDPIVLYDHLAGRWMMSQFVATDTSDDDLDGPFYECIAISATSDPTGAYYRYEFLYHEDIFNDYPHLGVWPDAYYMSVNQFGGASGAGAVAFEREAMLQGKPARMVMFNLATVNPVFRGQLAADLDGPPPPPGTPGIFAEVDDSSRIGPSDALRIWEFKVDWSNPAASTFGLGSPGQPNQVIPVAQFTNMLCKRGPVTIRYCVKQPGPPLDSLGERLMFRLVYRNFGDHQVLLANHTVDADGNDTAGVRWYELRRTGTGPWAIRQQSTYQPDGDGRWMGALAMDRRQGIGLGYSVAGPTTFPAIRYAGRMASDPLSTLPRTEQSLVEGSGSQLYPDPTQSRWGDYSSMSVDPIDDCTFWYTQEYTAFFDVAPWQTRIGAFKFPNCAPPATAAVTGRVLDAATSTPVAGAFVEAGAYSATTDATGTYRLPPLLPGSYGFEVSAPGYATATRPGVALPSGASVQDFSLTPVSIGTVTGKVLDAGGQGYPLYARIDIDGYAGGPVFTNPLTGVYSVRLAHGTHHFTVNAVTKGYGPVELDVASPTATADAALAPLGSSCPAGYKKAPGGLFQPFEGGTTPAGWSVVDNAGMGQGWEFDNPGGRPNQTGGTGGFAAVDSDAGGAVGMQDAELISPSVNLSSRTKVVLEFDTDFHWYDAGMDEQADVDVSNDGGASWQNVWNRSGAEYRGPHHERIDISSLAAGKANVKVRFHYYQANFEYWWLVDNASLGVACTPLAGGLVVGRVTKAADGAAINGATIRAVATPDNKATSLATPEDLVLGDGHYVLFVWGTGAKSLSASAPGFATAVASVLVEQGKVKLRDWPLPAAF